MAYDLSKVVVTSSPHIKADDDTRSLMLDVLIALVPALAVAIYTFGVRALIHVIIAMVSCAVFETIYNKIVKHENTVGDLSCFVTGVLIAFNIPVAAPPDVSIVESLLGQTGGVIGETSALALIVGGLYLLWRKVITINIPAAYILTVAVITFLFPMGGQSHLQWMLYQVLDGGLMLGAIFMATDYVTSPVTPKGQIVFGVGCGLLTVFIRYFGGLPEGVSYSILIMNTLVWAIDKKTHPRKFGYQLDKVKKEAQ